MLTVDESSVATLTLAIGRDDSGVLHSLLRNDLHQAIEEIAGSASITGVLLLFTTPAPASSPGTDELSNASSPLQIRDLSRSFQALIRRLETCGKPVVAVLDGATSGARLDIALGCHYRVLANDAASLRFSEGAMLRGGGTQRLPRLVGVAKALPWLLQGGELIAQQALRAQLIHEIASDVDGEKVARAWLATRPASVQPWDSRGFVVPGGAGPLASFASQSFMAGVARLRQQGSEQAQGSLNILSCVYEGTITGFDAALRIESNYFARLMTTPRAPRLAAVIGAGVMGGGIAYTSAFNGIPVLLKDISEKQLELGVSEARKLAARQVAKSVIDEAQAKALLESITPLLDYTGFDRVSVVVEAVVEDVGVKHRVLRELEAKVAPAAVIATNTSSLRIDELAKAMDRPERLVGMHFFNPVPVMPLVEVIRGTATSEAAVQAIVGYSRMLRKTPIVVKDGPGFLVNRVLTPYMMAASRLIADGCDFTQLDRVMEAFGWPMGPAYLNDVVGMDVGAHVTRLITQGFPDRMRQTWNDSVALLVANGRLGQKTGLGFYRHDRDEHGKPRRSVPPGTHELLSQVQENGTRSFSDQQIVERMMLPMVIESAHALEEQAVGGAAELDLAMTLGLGFPKTLGGPLRYADNVGLEALIAMCRRHEELGPMYRPTAQMLNMARRSRRYHS